MISAVAAAFAALLFLIALILDVLDTASDAVSTLTIAGFLLLAVALTAWFVGRPGRRRAP